MVRPTGSWTSMSREGDHIDLSRIDADVYAAGNQAFTFIGTAAFSGTPGEVRYYQAGGNTYLQMRTGMSADIEGVIRIDGIHPAGELVPAVSRALRPHCGP